VLCQSFFYHKIFAFANGNDRYTGTMATDTPTTAQQSSSVLIALLARGMRRRIDEALEPVGVRPRHLLVLTHLRTGGPAAQQTLLDVAGVDPSNLVGLLNELEDAGLIVRSRDRADRRRGVIELSRKGRRVLGDVDRALHAVDDEVLAALGEGERAELNALLARAAEGIAGSCSEPPDEAC
jgi:DNA-binding MarR family transcriptional regulator